MSEYIWRKPIISIFRERTVNREIDPFVVIRAKQLKLVLGVNQKYSGTIDDFFTLIDKWFESFPIGTNPPRDEKVIKQSMYEAVVNNPKFSIFEDNTQFKNLIRKLKNNC